MEKVCFKCKVSKPVDQFYSSKQNRDGLQSWCRSCHGIEVRKHRASQPIETRRRSNRKANLMVVYKLSIERFEEMAEAQGYCCAVCNEICKLYGETGDGDIFHVDHDHRCCSGYKSCGKCVRGLLCRSCNRALGELKDDPKLLKKAYRYLVRYPL